MTEYISPEALAKKLNITTGTLATWRHTGRHNLPYIKVGRKVMYKAEAVQEWLATRTHLHTMEGK